MWNKEFGVWLWGVSGFHTAVPYLTQGIFGVIGSECIQLICV